MISLAALSVPHPQAFTQALVTGNQATRSWYMAACQLPWLPERVLSRRDGQPFRDILVRTGLDLASADRYAARCQDPAALRGPLNWYRAMPFSLREPPGPIRVPTLFAWGNRDQFISRSAARRCRQHVTGPYRFAELDGASHWLPEQAPDQVAATIDRALRSHRLKAGGRQQILTGTPGSAGAITRHQEAPRPKCLPARRQPKTHRLIPELSRIRSVSAEAPCA